jgi:choloylglycine hydrolase
MNETGLVVEQMWLDDTEYPAGDGRLVVPELQWIQYQLDNCRTVKEVLATDKKIRIDPSGAKLHFLVCDSQGDIATIEFVKGKMVHHRAGNLPEAVLTNSTYSTCMGYLKKHVGFGGKRKIPASSGSEDRFVRAASMVAAFDTVYVVDAHEYAFSVLDTVAQGNATHWSIVYDVKRRQIHFKTQRDPAVKTVKLSSFDFSCKKPALIMDIDSAPARVMKDRFETYTTARNRELVVRAMTAYTKAGFFREMPSEDRIFQLSSYPETLPCRE